MTLHAIGRSSLVRTTFGNLGNKGYGCASGAFGDKVRLNCTHGVVDALVAAGFAEDGEICSYEVVCG